MNREQKRIKIAESQGWKWYVHVDNVGAPSAHPGCRFLSLPGEWMNSIACREAEMIEPIADTSKLPPSARPPDYFNDLHSCAELEKSLDAQQLNWYENELAEVCNLKVATMAAAFRWHATASQRAEAYGLTMELWSREA